MFRRLRPGAHLPTPTVLTLATRSPRSATTMSTPKPTGDISSVFLSLSNTPSPSLPPRFAAYKANLISGHESQVVSSWHRLLSSLQHKRREIRRLGSTIVPEINFWDLSLDIPKRTAFRDRLKETGVAVIRAVVSEEEAEGWRELAGRYIRSNHHDVRGS